MKPEISDEVEDEISITVEEVVISPSGYDEVYLIFKRLKNNKVSQLMGISNRQLYGG